MKSNPNRGSTMKSSWYVADYGMEKDGCPVLYMGQPLPGGRAHWGTMDTDGEYQPIAFPTRKAAERAKRQHAQGLRGIVVVRI